MKRKIKEQITYGDRPERMDPNLERKLGDPEGLYAQNPAMIKGVDDVQRLVSKRFQKVAQKLSDVTGIEDLSSRQTQGMIFQEMMSKLPRIMQIERRHKEELEILAVDAALEETETPPNVYQIDATLSSPNTQGFRMGGEGEEDCPECEKYGAKFDLDEFTKEEEFVLEKHKRNIINAIVQGAAKKGHYLFQKPEIKSRLDAIDPSLYGDYLGIMAINDFLYFSMEQMIEMMSQSGQGIAGKVELDDADEEEQEDGIDTKIVANGLIFPILCHEVIKGIEEAKARHGLPDTPEMRQRVMKQTDVLSNEPMQLRIGPEIVEKIRFALPDEMYDEKNKGLINFFHVVLYKLPAREFLKIIANVISENESRLQKGKDTFRELMQDAQKLKTEFEEYKEEKNIESDEDDEEDIDDFLKSIGIDPIGLN